MQRITNSFTVRAGRKLMFYRVQNTASPVGRKQDDVLGWRKEKKRKLQEQGAGFRPLTGEEGGGEWKDAVLTGV